MPAKSLTVHERMPLPARRLINVAQQLLKQGKSPATHAIREGQLYVNGSCSLKPDQVLRPGDVVELRMPPPRPARPTSTGSPSRQPLEIIYNDDHLLVVNKPPGLLTVPTPYKERTTLISLVDHWIQARDRRAQAYCVHRLDRGVSGLLIFAKWLKIAEQLRDQFEARKPQRKYVAIVEGVVSPREGTFRSHITTDKRTLQRHSTEDEEAGQLAITHYQVHHIGDGFSVVDVRLETGRRNQIRVHFSEAGHPILGDVRYSHDDERPKDWPYRRLALHAQSLGFTHPITGEPLEFHSKLPPEFAKFMPKGT